MENPDQDEASGSSENNVALDLEALRKFFEERLGFAKSESIPTGPPKLEKTNVESIVKYIQSGECKTIVTMAGAGISTSAGIPDFRSPGSGLYDNLEKYQLPNPMAIFEIDYFKHRPEAFFTLAKELYPGSFKPTVSHYFLRLLHQKNLLLRHFTQNIDNLERIAGLPDDTLVEAHGSFHTSHCLTCRKEYNLTWMEERVFSDVVPTCERCNGIVKPDIVFFGENLPKRYFQLSEEDFPKADLLLILGTSLAVQPFCSLIDIVPRDCPRLLINKEKVGLETKDSIMGLLGLSTGLSIDSKRNVRDVFIGGDCDSGCQRLADMLGWGEELKELVKTEHARLDLEMKQNKKKRLISNKTVDKEPVGEEGAIGGKEAKKTETSKKEETKEEKKVDKKPKKEYLTKESKPGTPDK